MEKLIGIDEFLRRTGLERVYTYRLIKRGALRATQPGGKPKTSWYVYESEVDRILSGTPVTK